MSIDLLEQQILHKVKEIGALRSNEYSTELFDPNIISFNNIQNEIERLRILINNDYVPNSSSLKLELVKMALKILNNVTELKKQSNDSYSYSLQSLELLTPLFKPLFDTLKEN